MHHKKEAATLYQTAAAGAEHLGKVAQRHGASAWKSGAEEREAHLCVASAGPVAGTAVRVAVERQAALSPQAKLGPASLLMGGARTPPRADWSILLPAQSLQKWAQLPRHPVPQHSWPLDRLHLPPVWSAVSLQRESCLAMAGAGQPAQGTCVERHAQMPILRLAFTPLSPLMDFTRRRRPHSFIHSTVNRCQLCWPHNWPPGRRSHRT